MRKGLLSKAGIAGTIFGAMVGATAVACWAGAAVLQSVNPEAVSFEQSFLQSFAAHQEEAIAIEQLCTEKSTHAELKDLCQHMVTMQTDEKLQMAAWLKDWYEGRGTTPLGTLARSRARQMATMARLHLLGGSSFDPALLATLGEHHQLGIAEADKCILQAEHVELKALCGRMKTEQQDELDRMNQWERSWK